MKSKDLCYRLYLAISIIIIVFAIYFILNIENKEYGSLVDWLSQHVAYADYFRNDFYETGELYPDFSMQLGGGINMAQLIYYGVFRPEILVSYLFPMIPMHIWLPISSIIILIVSAEVLYHWLRTEQISMKSAFIASLFFVCAGPVVFHTHRHPMFTNYFPWMIITFMGIHTYVCERKVFKMLFGIVMMILSSYYFSVSTLFTCGIYAIYCICKEHENITVKVFITEALRLFILVCLGIGLTAFLLLPIALSMVEQHREVLQNPSFEELLSPTLDMRGILTNSFDLASYSPGMGMMAYIAVLYWVTKNKRERILAVLILLVTMIPAFCYVLNGMQYIRQKSLIPFIPLICFLVGKMQDSIKKDQRKTLICCLPFIFLPLIFMEDKLLSLYHFIDAVICIITLYLYMKHKRWEVLLCSIVIPFVLLKPINMLESFPKKAVVDNFNAEDKKELVSSILDRDASLYRFDDLDFANKTTNQVLDQRMMKSSVYSSNNNQDMVHYFYDTMAMPGSGTTRANMHAAIQPFYQGMMGIKYILISDKIPAGYHVILEKSNWKVVENDNVMPLVYATSDIINLNDFSKLEYPYSIETLFQRTVVEKGDSIPYMQKLQKLDLSYNIESIEGVNVTSTQNGYKLKVKTKGRVLIRLNEALKGKLLFIDFSIQNVRDEKKNNVSISINGIINKRSKTEDFYANHKNDFHYIIESDKAIDTLAVSFSQGEYEVRNFKTYILDENILKERKQHIDEMKLQRTDDSLIAGTIDVRQDGYFVTSLPYQNGFKIELDGHMISYEKVNTAFVGFPIKEGKHTVKIAYHMPGKREGIAISMACLGIAILLHFRRKLVPDKRR